MSSRKSRRRDALSPLVRSNCLIDVGESGVHGIGAFASQDLGAEQRIGVYDGRRLSAEDAESLSCTRGITYVFGLSDGQVIDGSNGGNATRHINHSCEPNCVAWEEDEVDGSGPIVTVHALRNIAAGEELFLDYSLVVDAKDEHSYGCHCRAHTCRGTMVGSIAKTEPRAP